MIFSILFLRRFSIVSSLLALICFFSALPSIAKEKFDASNLKLIRTLGPVCKDDFNDLAAAIRSKSIPPDLLNDARLALLASGKEYIEKRPVIESLCSELSDFAPSFYGYLDNSMELNSERDELLDEYKRRGISRLLYCADSKVRAKCALDTLLESNESRKLWLAFACSSDTRLKIAASSRSDFVSKLVDPDVSRTKQQVVSLLEKQELTAYRSAQNLISELIRRVESNLNDKSKYQTALKNLARDSSIDDRYTAEARLFSEIGLASIGSEPYLHSLFQQGGVQTKVYVLRALRFSKDKETKKLLLKNLQSEVPAIRAEALHVLSILHPNCRELTDSLGKFDFDSDGEVWAQAWNHRRFGASRNGDPYCSIGRYSKKGVSKELEEALERACNSGDEEIKAVGLIAQAGLFPNQVSLNSLRLLLLDDRLHLRLPELRRCLVNASMDLLEERESIPKEFDLATAIRHAYRFTDEREPSAISAVLGKYDESSSDTAFVNKAFLESDLSTIRELVRIGQLGPLGRAFADRIYKIYQTAKNTETRELALLTLSQIAPESEQLDLANGTSSKPKVAADLCDYDFRRLSHCVVLKASFFGAKEREILRQGCSSEDPLESAFSQAAIALLLPSTTSNLARLSKCLENNEKFDEENCHRLALAAALSAAGTVVVERFISASPNCSSEIRFELERLAGACDRFNERILGDSYEKDHLRISVNEWNQPFLEEAKDEKVKLDIFVVSILIYVLLLGVFVVGFLWLSFAASLEKNPRKLYSLLNLLVDSNHGRVFGVIGRLVAWILPIQLARVSESSIQYWLELNNEKIFENMSKLENNSSSIADLVRVNLEVYLSDETKDVTAKLKNELTNSHFIILVCGAEGSGKTTAIWKLCTILMGLDNSIRPSKSFVPVFVDFKSLTARSDIRRLVVESLTEQLCHFQFFHPRLISALVRQDRVCLVLEEFEWTDELDGSFPLEEISHYCILATASETENVPILPTLLLQPSQIDFERLGSYFESRLAKAGIVEAISDRQVADICQQLTNCFSGCKIPPKMAVSFASEFVSAVANSHQCRTVPHMIIDFWKNSQDKDLVDCYSDILESVCLEITREHFVTRPITLDGFFDRHGSIDIETLESIGKGLFSLDMDSISPVFAPGVECFASSSMLRRFSYFEWQDFFQQFDEHLASCAVCDKQSASRILHILDALAPSFSDKIPSGLPVLLKEKIELLHLRSTVPKIIDLGPDL